MKINVNKITEEVGGVGGWKHRSRLGNFEKVLDKKIAYMKTYISDNHIWFLKSLSSVLF